MTGRLGGRSNVAHKPSPVAVPPPIVSNIGSGCGTPISLASGGGGTGSIAPADTALVLSGLSGTWCHVMVAVVWPTDTNPSWHGTMLGGGATWVDEGGLSNGFLAVTPFAHLFGFVGYAGGGLSGTPTFDLGINPSETVEVAWVIACLNNVDLGYGPFGRVQSDQDTDAALASCGGSGVFPTISGCDATVGATFSSGSPVGSPTSSPSDDVYATETITHGVLSGLFDGYAPDLSPVECAVGSGNFAYSYAINLKTAG